MNNIKKSITNLIITITVICFIIQTVLTFGATDSQSIYNIGGILGANLLQTREFSRLITPIFIHIGIMHLLFNMVSLYSVGPIVERVYSPKKYLLIYILCGIGGNIAAAVFSPFSVTAGASGAIFGLFGLLVGVGRNSNNSLMRSLGQSFMSVILMNLLMNLFTPGVSLAGHVGGAITGYICAKFIPTDYRY